MVISDRKHVLIFNQMVFLLLQRWGILYGTIKIQKKIPPGTQNFCQSHNIQYMKLKGNSNYKMGNLALTKILSAL